MVAHVHQKGKGYGSGVTKRLYRHLKVKGYNAIQLNTFAYQKNIESIRLFWDDPTLTKEGLMAEIRLIHSMGFKVMLKPHIWLGDSWNPTVWRSQINYEDPEKLNDWFSGYKKFLKEQVLAAVEENVEFFVIGTELVKLSRHTEYWRDLIRQVRDWGYNGKLTYACEAWNARNIDFWDDLDFIGLDFYYSYKNKPVQAQKLEDFYSDKLLSHLRHASKYNLEIMLTELGFPSHTLAISQPYLWRGADIQPDDDTQLQAYTTLRRAMERISYPYGLWIWKYVTTLDSYEALKYPTGFILQNKKAENEVSKMFK